MSAELILDAIASKVATVSGIKRAYGSAAGDPAVPTMVEDVADAPAAFVFYDGFTVDGHADWERVTHRFVVRIYVSSADVGAAYKALVPFADRMIVAFRSDADLGGTCQRALILGADRPEPEEVNGKPFLVLPVRVEAMEARVTSYSV